MIQKGIFLLVLFFGLSILVTLALSTIMKPDNAPYWIFLYIFATSQLFLFIHSLLYWYYTSGKFNVKHDVEKRSSDFDKRTLVIISAFNEDNEVLELTFNAVKKSFSGPVMLAVDAPRNVKSYIELCRNHDVICIHRIHRSGFKAGAINNVVLNFLKDQYQYIKKTRKEISDEIVLAINNSSKVLPSDLIESLDNLKTELLSMDKIITFSYDHFIFEHISNLTSEKHTNQLQPKDLDKLHSQIEYLNKKIDEIKLFYTESFGKLSFLNKVVARVNDEMKKLSPDIEYLQLETDAVFNHMNSIHSLQLISETEDCLKTLETVTEKKFLETNNKDAVFSIVDNLGKMLVNVYDHPLLFQEIDSKSSMNNFVYGNQAQLNLNRIKKLQTNLKTINSKLILFERTITSSYDHFIFEHISNLTSEKHTNQLQPKDLDQIRLMIKTQKNKLSDINNRFESIYQENLDDDIKQIGSDKPTKTFQLEDLNLLRSKIEGLEKKLTSPDSQTNQLQPKDLDQIRLMIKTQKSKLRDIDKSIESLYEKNFYDDIEQIGSNKQNPFLQLEDLTLLNIRLEDLEKNINKFYDLRNDTVILNALPELGHSLTKISNYMLEQKKFPVTDNLKNSLGKIEDLISEFYYTVNDLVAKLPLDIEYLVLLDSDAHPKSDPDPQNNFFDLGSKYIKENDLVVFPQFYDKEGGKLVRAAYAQQVPFMKTIMVKRGEDNTAFMLGTNILIKKNTLESVNGFDDSTVTEDLATTIKIHESKKKSKYLNKDVVVNGAPLSITGYFTQQQRWAYGTYQVFLHMLLKGVGNNLNLKSYIEYLYGNTWYFYGLTFLINALIPFYSIFWEGLIQIPADLFYVLYLPYVFTGIVIFLYSVLRTGHGFKDVFYNMSLNAICFFVYIKALFFILRGKKLPFEVTPKSGTSEETVLRLKKITPNLIVIGLLGFSLIVYGLRIITGETPLVPGLINVIWSAFFIALLSPVLSFK